MLMDPAVLTLPGGLVPTVQPSVVVLSALDPWNLLVKWPPCPLLG